MGRHPFARVLFSTVPIVLFKMQFVAGKTRTSKSTAQRNTVWQANAGRSWGRGHLQLVIQLPQVQRDRELVRPVLRQHALLLRDLVVELLVVLDHGRAGA